MHTIILYNTQAACGFMQLYNILYILFIICLQKVYKISIESARRGWYNRDRKQERRRNNDRPPNAETAPRVACNRKAMRDGQRGGRGAGANAAGLTAKRGAKQSAPPFGANKQTNKKKRTGEERK